MLCTWSIFPFFPLSFQLVMVKTKESGPSGDSDEFCPELSSGSVHSFHAPTPMLPPTSRIAAFRAAFPFRAAAPLQTETAPSRLTSPGTADRDRTFPAHVSGEVSGAALPSVSSAPPSTACSPAHPSTRAARPGWPSAWHLSPASHVSDFLFVCFLTFVACVAALCFTPWF